MCHPRLLPPIVRLGWLGRSYECKSQQGASYPEKQQAQRRKEVWLVQKPGLPHRGGLYPAEEVR